MAALSITWLGHSTFIITTPGGKRIVTDPWLEGNPKCPPDRKRIDAADVILLTHGHSDHSGDVVSVSRATNAPILAIHELSIWLEQKGLQNVQGMGIGGTVSEPAGPCRSGPRSLIPRSIGDSVPASLPPDGRRRPWGRRGS